MSISHTATGRVGHNRLNGLVVSKSSDERRFRMATEGKSMDGDDTIEYYAMLFT